MIGQNADRDRLEWATLLNLAVDASKALNFSNQKIIAAICNRDCGEESTAREAGAPILRHLLSLEETWMAGTLRFARPMIAMAGTSPAMTNG